jgi:hypothetical protein
VAALFAMLGYNTEARLTQTTEAMGLTDENLKHEVRPIERIADQENGALTVYLAELRSMTVANTQALARALRNRAGIFLWVLTSDYERLDFVLFESIAPEAKAKSGLNAKGVSLRPRVLTAKRRDPGTTCLRVLRRFSCTEADADYQYNKLTRSQQACLESAALEQLAVSGLSPPPASKEASCSCIRSACSIAEWAEPFDELMDILHRNHTRLGVSLNDARFVARLKAEYEKGLAVLPPIKERLAFTDTLLSANFGGDSIVLGTLPGSIWTRWADASRIGAWAL